MKREPAIYVADILEQIEAIASFVEGMGFDTFAADRKTHYAVVRALTFMGEAAKRIPEDVRNRAPGVSWKGMAGVRDKVTHDYRGVNLELVWQTVQHDVPAVQQELKRLLAELDAEDEAAE